MLRETLWAPWQVRLEVSRGQPPRIGWWVVTDTNIKVQCFWSELVSIRIRIRMIRIQLLKSIRMRIRKKPRKSMRVWIPIQGFSWITFNKQIFHSQFLSQIAIETSITESKAQINAPPIIKNAIHFYNRKIWIFINFFALILAVLDLDPDPRIPNQNK